MRRNGGDVCKLTPDSLISYQSNHSNINLSKHLSSTSGNLSTDSNGMRILLHSNFLRISNDKSAEGYVVVGSRGVQRYVCIGANAQTWIGVMFWRCI